MVKSLVSHSHELVEGKKMVEIIAEVGSVHDGSFGNAIKLIDLAKNIGADIVKFQTHIASTETIKDAPMPSYFKGEPRYEYFNRTGFDKAQWKELIQHCVDTDIEFLSSPFSLEAYDLLASLGVKQFKIASGEVTNLPLIKRIAEDGFKVYLSSGMSTWSELQNAVSAVGQGDLVLLQCSSIYPCPAEQVGLNVIREMQRKFDVPVGYSDHSLGYAACLGAVALGAVCIEKHLTFSTKMYGSDASLAMEPREFATLVSEIRFLDHALQNPVSKGVSFDYTDMKRTFEKSIVALRNLEAGHILERTDLGFKKPGSGIAPAHLEELIGQKLNCAVGFDEALTWEKISND